MEKEGVEEEVGEEEEEELFGRAKSEERERGGTILGAGWLISLLLSWPKVFLQFFPRTLIVLHPPVA